MKMQIIFLQTADPYRYDEMLQLTSQTVKEYCARHGFLYESYTGIKRGYHNWQATYNRIYQLEELLQRGFGGWAIYMDADAYVYDPSFDLRSYLEERNDFGLVLTPSMATDHHWDINAGVVMINLGHEIGRHVVREWRAGFDGLSEQLLRDSAEWLHAGSDQDLIQVILRTQPQVAAATYLQSTDLINSNFATFIRQELRSYSDSFQVRLARIATEVESALRRAPDATVGVDTASTIAAATYRAILGRSPGQAEIGHVLEVLEREGLASGLERATAELVASEEFQARQWA
ncbi:hypothetical protein [Sphingomonas morindae]|uniref:Nucleotide-diphospho-sugar transferase domain-containing protein n=1 Tax=Sphingomonas morindae TaxID=1541170 RepID=A0ABY4X621_9SPHN|nr:hypothetical protein [Sphingomonas morindae]USI72359.1 hypothetical protein LHA26_13815 [Sphingomonas morindae]